jgi:mono/diheme cytochrome c family protein
MKDVQNSFRDDAEPSVRQGAVYLPMWIVGLLAVLIYWGCSYVDARGGDYNELVYEPFRSTNELASVLPKDETIILIQLGKQVYGQFCLNCHQDNGLGSPSLYPPLVGSEWVLGSPNRLIPIPETGLSGPIKVNGVDWNLSMPMVAGQGLMSDEKLAAVLTYIRRSWGNNAPAVTPEQVKKVRAQLAGRGEPHTAEELLARPADL